MATTNKNTVYTVEIALLPRSERTTKTTSGTLEELCKYFSNILEKARSYKKSISLRPRSIEKLIENLDKADMVLKGRPYHLYTIIEEKAAEDTSAEEAQAEATVNTEENAPATDKPLTADQKFAEQIVAELKNGTAPWVKPWQENEAFSRMPVNAISKAQYRGANILRLFMAAGAHGYSDPRWMTFKQAAEKDMHVRKGEHGTPISFYKRVAKEFEDAEGETKQASYMACKTYTVFNAEQIEGMPPINAELPERKWQPVEIGERILENSHAKIRYDGGNRAFYNPAEDTVHLPMRAQFGTASGFYGTACHELAHWTGAKGRLARDIENTFGSETYAKEELRAEIASWMLAVHTGLPFDPSEHSAYVGSWVKAIKNDYREIFRACADAQKIVDFLMQGIQLEEQNAA